MSLQSEVVGPLAEEKHDQYPAASHTRAAQGSLFFHPNPILIPDFDRNGEAMPMPQKSPSKTRAEGLKIQ